MALGWLLALAFPVLAQQCSIGIDHFGGLNDSDAAATIAQEESQDCLNVESNINGTAIFKRKGFTQEASLTVATAPITGAHSFIDSSGNQLTIVCHDHYCSKSANFGAFAVFLTTAIIPTRWQFVDVNGTAYFVNDKFDPLSKYDGTTLSNIGGAPGSVIELTKDRLVVGGTSANPNRVFYSAGGNYSNFTTGLNSADPYTDDLGTPGDKITGLKYDRGRLFVFKRNSIISCLLGDQYTSKCFPISNVIGTSDPSSIVSAPDGVYFKSQDRTYWRIDDNGLELISKKINNLVQSQTSGSTQNNIQTTQADWTAGAQFPGMSWDTTTFSGSIFPSSGNIIITTGTDFSGGVVGNISTAIPGAISLIQLDSATFTNAGAESGSNLNWNLQTFQIQVDSMYGAKTWSTIGNATCPHGNTDTLSTLRVQIVDSSSNVITGISPQIREGDNVATQYAIETSTLPYATIGIKVHTTDDTGCSLDAQSVQFIRPQRIRIKVRDGDPTNLNADNWDIDEVGPFTSSGSFTSPEFDTLTTTPTWGTVAANITSGTVNTVKYLTRVAGVSGGTYDAAVAVDSALKIQSAQKRYVKFISTFTVTTSTDPAPILYDASLLYATTGTYRTQCIQPNTNISAWGIMSCAESKSGNGSLVYYATSAATCATLPSTRPLDWQTTVTNNATMSNISTNTAVYIGFRSLLGSATDQAQVDACTIYWNNGVVAPPVFGLYEPIKNSIYWTTSINNSSTNNRLLKYDLNLNQWYPFSLTASSLKLVNNSLYFGSASSGTWNKYGSSGIDSDNGTTISSYWKSKDFGCASPFQETDWKRASIIAKNQTTGSMTETWTLSNGKTGTYNISLSTTSTLPYIRSNHYLPGQSPANFLNLQFGNNSQTPFEIDGLRIDGNTNGWLPVNP